MEGGGLSERWCVRVGVVVMMGGGWVSGSGVNGWVIADSDVV